MGIFLWKALFCHCQLYDRPNILDALLTEMRLFAFGSLFLLVQVYLKLFGVGNLVPAYERLTDRKDGHIFSEGICQITRSDENSDGISRSRANKPSTLRQIAHHDGYYF